MYSGAGKYVIHLNTKFKHAQYLNTQCGRWLSPAALSIYKCCQLDVVFGFSTIQCKKKCIDPHSKKPFKQIRIKSNRSNYSLLYGIDPKTKWLCRTGSRGPESNYYGINSKPQMLYIGNLYNYNVRQLSQYCQNVVLSRRNDLERLGFRGYCSEPPKEIPEDWEVGGMKPPKDLVLRHMPDTSLIDLKKVQESVRYREQPQRVLNYQTFEDHLFEILRNDKDKVTLSRFISGLRSVGLRTSDPRLQESMTKLKQLQDVFSDIEGREVLLDEDTFKECIKDNIVLIRRAFTADFVIPEFVKFCQMIDQIYWNCRTNTGGRVASYIPQLSRYSADYWGVSLCTIDGQRYSAGDVSEPFSIQSCSKPLTYALALNELGSNVVHEFIGQEPSGEVFNMIKLDVNNKPHNPMINAGAILVASLLKNNLRLADRFDYVSQQYKKLAGGEYLGFNNGIFLSERETADRNFALGYYMKEKKCFPDGVNLAETMDFYFQLCSVEVTCESASVIAATLANGGICPLTGEQVLSGEAVRNTLSLMHSCGMYDYSGQFAFKCGLPAKSGVSGVTLLVVPNVMGVCLWSPPLDQCGNSVRGIQFCEELVETFNFHHYDNLLHTRRKTDPRTRRIDKTGQEVVSLLFGAYNGDLSAITRMALGGIDMGICDYDGRTALHLATSEGHMEIVKFLVEKCKVNLHPKDRWGHTPLDDAIRFNRYSIKRYLENYIAAHPDVNVISQKDKNVMSINPYDSDIEEIDDNN